MPRTKVEYADYNITVYRSCPYMCTYCYVWRSRLFTSRVLRGKYDPVAEARRIALQNSFKPKRIVVSFTSDPYPYQETWYNLTRKVVETITKLSKHTVMILTKNPLIALKDLDIIANPEGKGQVWIGTTITSADTTYRYSIELEPGAPRTDLRLTAMQIFADRGAQLWFSIEPILPVPGNKNFYPETIVEKIIKTIGDPDKIKLVVLGKLNYTTMIRHNIPLPIPLEEKEITKYYREHVPQAIDLLRFYGIKYIVKKELRRVLGEK